MDASEVTITREQLAAMVERMITDNAAVHDARTTLGQECLDTTVAVLYAEGEIELAAAIGLLHGFRVLGHHAVALASTRLLETAAELNPGGLAGRIARSN